MIYVFVFVCLCFVCVPSAVNYFESYNHPQHIMSTPQLSSVFSSVYVYVSCMCILCVHVYCTFNTLSTVCATHNFIVQLKIGIGSSEHKTQTHIHKSTPNGLTHSI